MNFNCHLPTYSSENTVILYNNLVIGLTAKFGERRRTSKRRIASQPTIERRRHNARICFFSLLFTHFPFPNLLTAFTLIIIVGCDNIRSQIVTALTKQLPQQHFVGKYLLVCCDCYIAYVKTTVRSLRLIEVHFKVLCWGYKRNNRFSGFKIR